ncbi:MAG: MBL fold metallo-hydrolase [Clostridia bacterium]|nr:MBL fold metallo-hydrolase [Clostridia bacterium]
MDITWYGTASIKLSDGKTNLLFDPYLRPNKKLRPITLDSFTGADAILVTHGHVDHIADIPKITEADKRVPVYCTKTPAATLRKFGVAGRRIHEIAPGNRFSIGDFRITVYQGRHVDFDARYIAQVFPQCFVKFPVVFKMEYYNILMPEKGEIVIYEVENKGKRIVLMGSYGTADGVSYPKNPDAFVLPYGGNSNIAALSAPFIKAMSPKKIIVDHYDASFPPLTKRMDVEGFGRTLAKDHPEIKYVIPQEYVPLAV